MKKTKCLIFVMLLSLQMAVAQKAISGLVTDSDSGEPLIGASILVKGTSQGTITDVDGAFTMDLPSEAEALLVSYIGYETKEITIGDANNFSITLKQGNILSEVVVVGYTSQRKEDLTGSVAVVEMKPIKNNSSGNVMQALQGRVPGLYIEKDGSPNGSNSRILIRGANTLGNNDPLYVIDGIPTTRPEVFQNMNPANIASVQVLKDASAESIYGSRASNGVIIVTTKMEETLMVKLHFNLIQVLPHSLKNQ